MAKRNIKSIAVHIDYYNKIFEPKRKYLQKQLGLTNLSQSKFTKMLSNEKIMKDILKKSRRKNAKFSLF